MSNSANKIGRYEIQQKIGAGAYGVVYKAMDPVLDRVVAIKVPSMTLDDEELANLIMEFYREARIGAKFRHANIVTVYDLGCNDHGDSSASEGMKMHYLVMEYVPGLTLKEYRAQEKDIPITEILQIMFECCKALDYIHFHNIVHRDIKLGNIVINPNYSTVKIMDFGISDQVDRKAAKGAGTLLYMAPEHFIEGKQLTPKTDIFALGSVMYQMITGKPPFRGETVAEVVDNILNNDPVPIQKFCPDIPDKVVSLVNKAMEKDDSKRYSSALDFANAITQVLDSLGKGDKSAKGKPKGEWDKTQKNEEYLFLRDNSWFKDFSPDLIEELVRVGEIETYGEGQIIVTEGELADAFYTILSGTANVIKNSHEVDHMSAGDCFGELGHVASNARRTATVIAKTPTRVLKISMDTLSDLSPANQAALYKGFLRVTMERLTERSLEVTELIDQMNKQ